MSAPHQGRQSPDPEHQSGAQGKDPIASDPNKQGAAPEGGDAAETSKDQLKGLESNPKGPLEDAAAAKVSKTT